MSYRETRRRCPTCGRETLHWRPWFELRPAFHARENRLSVTSLFAALRLAILHEWRCLECDHPWHASLLRRRS